MNRKVTFVTRSMSRTCCRAPVYYMRLQQHILCHVLVHSFLASCTALCTHDCEYVCRSIAVSRGTASRS